MHISKVELENIKSHVDSKFEFSRGTTAITGENGAGKTTIIEAIAWTLFDVLDYKKEDFVRRGANKGSARVTFESGLDERDYVVYRDTGTVYYVLDPRLGKRIADKREEVTRFLWQHLGLEPGTDLRALFREAVGVPQGTPTAIFLGTPLERKATFDRLLKVEEYRQAAEKLRETVRFIDAHIAAIEVKIARAEGELSRFETVEAEYKLISQQVAQLGSETRDLAAQVAAKTEILLELDAKEKRLTELTSIYERLLSDKERAEFVYTQREAELREAVEAERRIEQVKAAAERHIELLGHLKELDRERIERDKLAAQLSKVEAAEASVRGEKKRAEEALEVALRAHVEIKSLVVKITEQEQLEKKVSELRTQVAQIQAIQKQTKGLDDRLARLRESYKANQTQLREAESNLKAVGRLPELELRDTQLVRRVSELRATLDRDRRFQEEIKNGLCPILSDRCRNMKDGETLETFITTQFSDLQAEITTLENEHATVAADLRTSRSAEKFIKSFETLKARENELTAEGKYLADERQEMEKQLVNLPDIEHRLADAETRLKTLNDPRLRTGLLEKEAARETLLRVELSKIDKNLERLESDRRLLVEQLQSYKDLDAKWSEFSTERDATADAYRTFIANEALAKAAAGRQKAFENARIEVEEISKQVTQAELGANAARQNYDRDRHLEVRASLFGLERQLAETHATLAAAKSREEQLARELARFAEIRDSLTTEFAEKTRMEKTAETAEFIRATLKEAAPRVARNYVYYVSLEANQLYREICGKPEQSLEWNEDYGIALEEDGHTRPFISLSGGEQMAAALSVRLAILKQLSDIRIAFFDEPTTNMDAERRENLAMQISQIKNFDQLFVISHDDTFEAHVDNNVRLVTN